MTFFFSVSLIVKKCAANTGDQKRCTGRRRNEIDSATYATHRWLFVLIDSETRFSNSIRAQRWFVPA
jgi:hypothetical protein